MAQSRLSGKNDQGTGTRPGDLGAGRSCSSAGSTTRSPWPVRSARYKLGPHEYNSKKPQGLVVVLPKKEVTDTLVAPYAGTRTWWSGAGDALDNSMSRSVTLPAGTSTLSFQAQYDIEDCGDDPCDYAYVEVDDGTGWTAIPGRSPTPAEGNGIDGTSAGWVPATFDLSAYAGKAIELRVRYCTDPAAQGNDPALPDGIFVDALTVTAGSTVLLADGAETSPNGWDLDGFASVGATRTLLYDNYYIASYRAYVSYDQYLKTGPYHLGFLPNKPDFVEHFPYQNGLLVSYWDTSQADNSTGNHPGQGLILPIDANPRPIYKLDGTAVARSGQRVRRDLRPGEVGFVLPARRGSAQTTSAGQSAKPKFDDTRTFWYAEDPYTGVKTPNVGVVLKVTKQSKSSMTVKLRTSTSITPADVRASLAKR